MKMKIATTGSKGKIGQRLVALGATPLFCDITDQHWIRTEIERVKPDVIIHAAAISSIDRCEQDLEKAILINTRGANAVFEEADEVLGEGKVVLLSSEQVFDGKIGHYKENDEPFPINDYGRTKCAAEGLASLYGCKVLRLSRGICASDNDIKGVMTDVSENRVPDVPDFLYRSYCHLDFVAQAIWGYANRFEEMPEILHFGGSKVLSFYQLVRMIVGSDALLMPRKHEINTHTPRPFKCGFDISLWREYRLPVFTPQESVERLLNE